MYVHAFDIICSFYLVLARVGQRLTSAHHVREDVLRKYDSYVYELRVDERGRDSMHSVWHMHIMGMHSIWLCIILRTEMMRACA